jgi:hypothetical protein
MALPHGCYLPVVKSMKYSLLLWSVILEAFLEVNADSNSLSAAEGFGLQNKEGWIPLGDDVVQDSSVKIGTQRYTYPLRTDNTATDTHRARRVNDYQTNIEPRRESIEHSQKKVVKQVVKEASVAAARRARQPEMDNPLLMYYRRETRQYQRDAVAAEKAAMMYSKMAQEAVPIAAKAATKLAKEELSRIDVDTWAHSTWQFEQMLHNPLPGKAAAAAAAAAAPIEKVVGDYAKSETAYDVTAQEYGNRVALDTDLSKKLITYAHQYALQGNKEMSDAYDEQATLLMNQATKFADISKSYHKMATKIFNVIPILQGMAGTTGDFAAWKVDPGQSLPAEHVFPFTPVPPLEFVQTADEATTAKSQSSFLSR